MTAVPFPDDGQVSNILPIPTPFARAQAQIEQAIRERSFPTLGLPRPKWPGIARLTGPLMPGHLGIVGARPGNGKTTFLLQLFDSLVMQSQRVIYLGTETSAADLRSQWAATLCKFNVTAVLENDWCAATHILSGEEALANFSEMIAWQNSGLMSERAVFVDMPVLNRTTLRKVLIEYKVEETHPILLLDHFHRWDSRDPRNATAELAEVVRDLKGYLSRSRAMMIVAAQLNRPQMARMNVLSEAFAPPLSALKQTGALEEEANWVLMLHRQRRADVTGPQLKEVEYGQRDARSLLEDDVMCVTAVKNRSRPKAVGVTSRLSVKDTGALEEA